MVVKSAPPPPYTGARHPFTLWSSRYCFVTHFHITFFTLHPLHSTEGIPQARKLTSLLLCLESAEQAGWPAPCTGPCTPLL